MNKEYKNKVILITGASSGIGFECASLLCNYGASVAINGRYKEKLDEAGSKIESNPGNLLVVPGDIRCIETCNRIVDRTVSFFGKIDILINNAGVYDPCPFMEHDEKMFDLYFDTLIKGPFFLSQIVCEHFFKNGHGVIINLGSFWAKQAMRSMPCSAYSAAKAALHSLTRSLAIELADKNIRVSGVAPGLVHKNPTKNLSSASIHPIGRDGVPMDIVEAIVYLASSKADWLSGETISVDGGLCAGRIN